MNVAVLSNNTEAFLFALWFSASRIVWWEGVNWICLGLDRNRYEYGRYEGGGAHTGDWLRKIKGKDHLEDMNVDGRVILILVLNRM
jgi:hypothetical protein